MVLSGLPEIRIKPSPFLAILEADLESLITGKIVITWLIAAFFLGTLVVIGGTSEAKDRIGSVLWLFILVWSLVVIGISAGSVSSEAGVIADSLLSKSVKRYEYILAKMVSRCSVVLMVYLVVSVILSLVAVRVAPVGSLDYYGWLRAILIVGLALLLLTIIGITFSTLTSSTIASFILVLLVWYGMLTALPLAEMDAASPTYLANHFPDVMAGWWSTTLWQMTGIFIALIVSLALVTLFYFENKDLTGE